MRNTRIIVHLLLLFYLPTSLLGNSITDSTHLLAPTPVIENLWSEGLDSQDKGYFLRALSLLDSSLCLLQDEVGLNHPLAAVSMNHLGNVYYENGYIGEAYSYQLQALEIRQQYFGSEHLETAKSFNNLANCYLAIGDYERAVLLYQQTAKIREASPEVEPVDLAAIYNNLGNTYLVLGQWANAKVYCEKALLIRQENLGEEDIKMAQSRLNLGNIFAAQHQPDSALICFEQAFPVYLAHYGDHHPQLAALYENMGNALTAQQHYQAAAQLLEKALSIREQFYGGAHPDLIRSCQNIGELWLQRGDYQQANQYFQQALDLLLSLWGEYHPQVAQAYEQLGVSQLYLGKITQAKGNFQQAVALRQSLFGQEHPFVAGSWLNLGNAVWEEGDYQQARQYFQKSLAIWAKNGMGWEAEKLKACLNISQTHLDQDQMQEALKSLATAQTYLDTTQLVDLASYWRTMATIHQRLTHYDTADQLLVKALGALQYEQFKADKEGRIPPLELLLCLQQKGLNYLAWAKTEDSPQMAESALRDLEEAIDWLLVLQTSYTTPEARQQMAALNQPLFEGAIASCVYLAEKGDDRESFYRKALVLSERNKSIRLLEASFLHNNSIPDSLLQAWQQASLYLNQLEKQLILEEQSLSRNDLRNLKDQLFYWQQRQAEINKELGTYKEQDTWNTLYLNEKKITDLQSNLKEDQLILSFFHGEEQLYVFALNNKEVLAKQLSRTFSWQTSILDLGKSIIRFPTTTSAEKLKADSSYTVNAQAIYQQLFTPLAEYTEPEQHLLIIPDGIFNYLPFEALLTASPSEPLRYRSYPYLLKDYTISYAYSISQWLNDQQRSAVPVRADKLCLAIAPTFTQEDKTLAPLEHNLSEAQIVLTQFPGKLLADSMATRAAFLANASEYAILHLATHALTNMYDGEYAYFVLAPDSLGSYSKLYVKDFYAQRWKAQLAVLSACETGIGNFQAGEGVISLGRGFAQAGVRSTVSSLWQINDTQTELLMEQFYGFLKKGDRKDDALQTAKLHLLNQSSHDLAHPFYWASYVPYGDMSPLKIKQGRILWWSLGALILLGLTYVYRQRNS